MNQNKFNIEPLILVDLFCGAGGMSLGFENAGFKVACAVDFQSNPLETYINNRRNSESEMKIINQDIKNIKGKNIINEVAKVSKKYNEIDVIIGGPPCQGFSLRGKRKPNDPRNNLVYDYFRIIREIKPEIFVFENVSGLLLKNNRPFLISIINIIKNLGYHFGLELLNSSDYGVPQNRERLIIIGSKSANKIIFPKKFDLSNNSKELIKELNEDIPKYDVIPLIKKKISVKNAISDIAYEKVERSPIKYRTEPNSIYQKIMRCKSVKLYNHITTRHKKNTKLIFSQFTQGASMMDIPLEYRTKRSSIQRMWADKPGRTITSCNEDFIHYFLDRIITIREMARLQSYPDTYIFYGTPTTGGDRRKDSCCQVQQVGNSVPPLLAQAIAEGVLKMLNIKSNNILKNTIHLLNKN